MSDARIRREENGAEAEESVIPFIHIDERPRRNLSRHSRRQIMHPAELHTSTYLFHLTEENDHQVKEETLKQSEERAAASASTSHVPLNIWLKSSWMGRYLQIKRPQ